MEHPYTITTPKEDQIMVVIHTISREEKENIAIARGITEDIYSQYRTHPHVNFNVLIDIRGQQATFRTFPNNVRSIYHDMRMHPQTHKLAVVGDDKAHHFVIQVIMTLSTGNINWFPTVEEAQLWFDLKS